MFPTPEKLQTIASIDLGSNSFHMIVARVTNNQFQVVDKLREMVRLGGGLDSRKNLVPEVEQRALDCLQRFGQRLSSLPQGSVRAVGTNTLRQVRDAGNFLRAAEAALGHPIEIISGREEARLVYLGVAHGLAAGNESRLVVDIGGGSTEVIVGKNFVPNQMESVHMGCVSMSRAFFADGSISEEAMRRAELAGALEMRPIKNEYRHAGWQQAIGSSGTVRAIHSVIQKQGWTEQHEGITEQGLKKLRNALIHAGQIDRLELNGLSRERRPVFAGGVAVLRAVFKALDIQQMQVSDKALREGLLYDMLGRIHHEDVRGATVEALGRRYRIDRDQAKRVANTARALFAQAAGAWHLQEGDFVEMLDWGAQLHEIGLTISHTQYHKHGAYLISHSDLAGFSHQEQSILANLVRGHRRKFPLVEFQRLPEENVHCAMQLCVLLRLAVLLHRARASSLRVQPLLTTEGDHLRLEFPENWLARHPLAQTELEQEAIRLEPAGFQLDFT